MEITQINTVIRDVEHSRRKTAATSNTFTKLAISGEVLCTKATWISMQLQAHRTWNFPKHGTLTF